MGGRLRASSHLPAVPSSCPSVGRAGPRSIGNRGSVADNSGNQTPRSEPAPASRRRSKMRLISTLKATVRGSSPWRRTPSAQRRPDARRNRGARTGTILGGLHPRRPIPRSWARDLPCRRRCAASRSPDIRDIAGRLHHAGTASGEVGVCIARAWPSRPPRADPYWLDDGNPAGATQAPGADLTLVETAAMPGSASANWCAARADHGPPPRWVFMDLLATELLQAGGSVLGQPWAP
jgi:hypothetical protein